MEENRREWIKDVGREKRREEKRREEKGKKGRGKTSMGMEVTHNTQDVTSRHIDCYGETQQSIFDN